MKKRIEAGCSMKFSDRFKALRKMKKMTQEELAKSLGISKSAVSMYERGEREPQSLDDLEAIADFFNVDIDYLMGREEGSTYYMDPQTADLANALKSNPGLRLLFDAGKDMPPEDILKTLDFIKSNFKKEDN
ncbi:helix-turn-helix domain-containing protein [Hornefia butyriciproducens]|uniref:helix-turn-helix domain-containing protein n=1 Tax=Hornefia butyriciproducens TaxID=2652293 RepID=UPI003F8CB8D9